MGRVILLREDLDGAGLHILRSGAGTGCRALVFRHRRQSVMATVIRTRRVLRELRIIRDRMPHFNVEGPEGLKGHKVPGSSRKPSKE